MGLLDGKRLLITGVITDASIAFTIARLAQQEGAQIVLTGFGRMSLVERVARKLADPPPVIELDVANAEHLDTLAERVREHVDGLDGVLHAIGFAPASCLGGGFLDAPWEDVATAIQVSTFSLKSLAVAALPLFGAAGGSIVGLDFDARVAWPA
ncbi:MAG: SDR family oxidoreductase, partial [Pseudonocardiales bacterium]